MYTWNSDVGVLNPDGTLYLADSLNNVVRQGIQLPLGAPPLEVTSSATGLQLQWPTEPAGFQPQVTASLTVNPSSTWLTNGVTSAAGVSTMALPATDSAAFFRLKDTTAP